MGPERAATKAREHEAGGEGKGPARADRGRALADLAGPDASTVRLRWVGWSDVRSPAPAGHEGTWVDLVAFLEAAVGREVATKDEAPAWSPTDATWRGSASVSWVFALALDCDNGGEWTRLIAALTAAGLAFYAHRTPGHGRAGACKWRVVLPMAAPASHESWSSRYSDARTFFQEVGGVDFDDKTKDVARVWFLPVSLVGDPPRETVSMPGAALDLSRVPRAAPSAKPEMRPQVPRAESPHAPKAERSSRHDVSPMARARAYMKTRDPAVQGAGGDNWTFTTAAKLTRGFALADHEAMDLLLEWNTRCVPPWSESELKEKVANARRYGTEPIGEMLQRPIGEWQEGPREREAERPEELATEVVELVVMGSDGATVRNGRRGNLKALPAPTDSRPVIQMTAALHEVVAAALEVLPADPDLYQRSGSLVYVAETTELDAQEMMPKGTPRVCALGMAGLRVRLCKVARFQKFDGRSKKWVDAGPADKVTSAVLEDRSWKRVRPLVGIAETPIVRPDLTIATAPGYDPSTGFLYWPSCEIPDFPDRPTRDQARAALEVFAEPFADFPYATEADRSVALAAVLTMLCRPAIKGPIPAFLFDASTRGSGKTKQADCASVIATGRPAPRKGWPGDDEELEKVLGAYALRGAALILLDNITTPFTGAPIEAILTATDTVDLRVLGKSEVPSLPWRAVVLGTGNNIDVRGDTTRRVLVSRLEPKEERPEERSDFRHPDLLGWLARARSNVIAAAMTIVRGWAAAGRPDHGCKAWGSFEAWSTFIPPALVWAGAANPMGRRLADDDPERASLGAFLEALQRFAPDGITARDLVAKLYPGGVPHPADNDNGPAREMRAILETMVPTPAGKAPSQHSLSKVLGKHRGRPVGGRKLESRTGHGGAKVYFVA